MRFEHLEQRKLLTTYYVATTGSDSNAGTLAAPKASLENVQSSVHPGDTVLLESGTYEWSSLWWYTSGTSSAPIFISAASGASVVIDGTYMPTGSAAFGLGANYVTVANLAITNSSGDGLDLYQANNCTVDNITVYGCQYTGIKVGDPFDSTMALTTYDTVEYCTSFDNSLENSPTERGTNQVWGAGIAAFGASDIVFNGNTDYQNFGEGLDIICSAWCYAQNNTVHDNFSVEVYLSNATYSTVQSNFIYCSGNSYYYRDGLGAVGISLANESWDFQNLNDYDTIQNNIVTGGSIGFAAYDSYGLGYEFRNTLVINNTFYGATEILLNIQNSLGYNTGDRIANNILEQTGATAALASFTSGGVSYDHNLWYGGDSDNDGMNGTGDVWGNPLMTSPGGTSVTGYELGSSSPAIGAGSSTAAPSDNFGWYSRGSSINIGAW